MLTGALMSWAAFSLVGGLTPATRGSVGAQAAVAILLPLLLSTATPLRRGRLPILLGSIVTVATLSSTSAALIPDVLLAAVVAAVGTRLAGAVGRRLRSGLVAEPADGGPAPSEHSDLQPGEPATPAGRGAP
jgi:hypothetical protein